MKLCLLSTMLILMYTSVTGQFIIRPGASVTMTGSALCTLENTDLINDGDFAVHGSRIVFSGDKSSAIDGTQFLKFTAIEIRKSNGAAVILKRPIAVEQQIIFNSGFLDLNGFDADLGTSGILESENEASRILGSKGGQVLFNTFLNGPVDVDPGNLGLVITTNSNLGHIEVRRGHRPQFLGGGDSSIRRYYEVHPDNNGSLDATVRIKYFDGELNSHPEASLEFFRSRNAADWFAFGFTSRNGTQNFVEKSSVDSIAYFTLSSPVLAPLPLHFVSVSTACRDGEVAVSWSTANEQGTDYFTIERSEDGTHWTAIGQLGAAGANTPQSSYEFIDHHPLSRAFYRVVEHDLNGSAFYSGISQSNCGVNPSLKLWPNPARDHVVAELITGRSSEIHIKLFDSKGALVRIRKAVVVAGVNQFVLDMSSLASGVYQFRFEWDNGMSAQTIRIVKQ